MKISWNRSVPENTFQERRSSRMHGGAEAGWNPEACSAPLAACWQMEPLHDGCATSHPPAAVIGLSSPGDSGDDADGPLGVRLMWQRVTLRSLCERTHGETSETSQSDVRKALDKLPAAVSPKGSAKNCVGFQGLVFFALFREKPTLEVSRRVLWKATRAFLVSLGASNGSNGQQPALKAQAPPELAPCLAACLLPQGAEQPFRVRDYTRLPCPLPWHEAQVNASLFGKLEIAQRF
ncbi:uncharacterized protein LOC105239640 [Ailuropoda melanoleuca]|uniref:uncharacterized protein LOC105239640 n=1 Tax=Ailuropoda melanoleuca TaxID=9646 RepID=UPI001494D894|nr:uncharacterized protein LOC105239640 [Ailuropoda melanoleuca]